MKKYIFIVVSIIVAISITIPLLLMQYTAKRARNIPSLSKTLLKETTAIPRLSTVATGLEVAWGLAFLPNGELLVTERPGRVRRIDTNGNMETIAHITVKQPGEGGLHGITVHPAFETNNYIYLYYTYGENGSQTLNRVVRYTLTNNTLENETIIVDSIPGARFHDGGRIKFGPDKMLYITTGDAEEPSLAQDKNSLAGKILRVTDEGKPVTTNPFGTLMYSYGHRNPQGIAWDSDEHLWETEHGSSTMDELNMIIAGENYGWPTVRGDSVGDGMMPPMLHSGADTWAPGGMAILSDTIYFVGLRGQALYEVKRTAQPLQLKTHLKGELGRIRDIVVGPDNMLYLTTSNRDGRGVPSDGDDKIIRVNPQLLSPDSTKENVDYQASFAIFTNGTFRIFTDSKYHNLSPDVYIQADNPNRINVKKQGITWGDFFATLPMSLQKDCLITGTKQEFCTDTNNILKFYINKNQNANALTEEIHDGDQLVVSYGPKNDPNIASQLQQIPQ